MALLNWIVPANCGTGLARRTALGWVALLSLTLTLASRAAPPAPPISETEVKADYLFLFTKYVEWPPSSFADTNRPVVVAVLGGLAGGGHRVGENRLIFHHEVLTGGLVGVRISGPVDIRPVISQGCRLIGDRFIVTKSEHNLIHELGGVPALERLQSRRLSSHPRSKGKFFA